MPRRDWRSDPVDGHNYICECARKFRVSRAIVSGVSSPVFINAGVVQRARLIGKRRERRRCGRPACRTALRNNELSRDIGGLCTDSA